MTMKIERDEAGSSAVRSAAHVDVGVVVGIVVDIVVDDPERPSSSP